MERVRWLCLHAYYNIQISYLYFVGRQPLLISLSGLLDLPYLVELWCISAFGGHIKLNIHQMTIPMTEW